MTEGEQLVLADANEFVRQTQNLTSDVPITSGIRPHPQIEVTETTLNLSRFGMEIASTPEPDAPSAE